jgi:hypothetical protein
LIVLRGAGLGIPMLSPKVNTCCARWRRSRWRTSSMTVPDDTSWWPLRGASSHKMCHPSKKVITKCHHTKCVILWRRSSQSVITQSVSSFAEGHHTKCVNLLDATTSSPPQS